jgi:asparagine synthase (glutamine-hydrolysing)
MCGIAGYIDFKQSGQSALVIRNMANRLAHRGPDGSGFALFSAESPVFPDCSELKLTNPQWVWQVDSNEVALGHCRLAVIDTSSNGHQPMCRDEKEAYWITYNGEVYNHRELRTELEKAGYRFTSNSDTEVVLNAYAHWGAQCVERFDGMWSFVIYDRSRKSLFGSRDRLGVKPFYYARNQQAFSFASEVKAFLEVPDLALTLNESAILRYLFAAKIEEQGETFFAEVQELHPGHSFELNLDNGDFIVSPYFSLETKSGQVDLSFDEASDNLYEVLLENVNKRMVSDVPVGFCLSGGLDSSTIVSLAAKIRSSNPDRFEQAPLKAFTAQSPPPLDETPFAREVAEAVGAEWIKTVLEFDDFLAHWKTINYHQDLPILSASTYAQFAVMRAASQHGISVMLDGQGADELFAGYNDFYVSYWNELLRKGKWYTLFEEFRSCRNSQFGVKSYFIEWAKYLVLKIPCSVGKSVVMKWRPERKMCAPRALKLIDKKDLTRIHSFWSLNDALSHHITRGPLKSLLHWEDRCAMQFSIESRTPFSDDPNLLEMAFSLPSEWKICEGRTKWIMRHAVSRVVPRRIIDRTDKLGFAVPQTDWLMANESKLRQLYDSKKHLDTLDLVTHSAIEANWNTVFSESSRWKEQFFVFRYVSYLLWIEAFDLSN